MALRFGFDFQIIQCTLNKHLSPETHWNYDVLGKYCPSIMLQGLAWGRGYSPGEPLWPCTAAQFSFLKVRMWAWYRELGEMWLLVLSTYRIAWPTCVWVRWACAQVCLCGFPSCGSGAISKDKKVAKAKRRVSVAPSKAGCRFVSSILEGIWGPSSMQRLQCTFWCLPLPLNSVLKHPDKFHRRGFVWMPHSPKSHTCLKLV